jgi:hypothetical protein
MNNVRYHYREINEHLALKIEARDLLSRIVNEWDSDPTTVRGFDLHLVERARKVVARIKELDALA